MSSGLIVTADDFGLATPVNEAVETACRRGILTCASLMVAGAAVEDAVVRARRSPTLRVGLHLTLVEGRPTLPPSQVPDLVGRDGRFREDMAAVGAAMFFRPRVRRQLYAEIEAQFRAFAATGLKLDHVTAHKHFHLHPTITGALMRIGRRFGLSAARAPNEPRAVIQAAEPQAAADRALVTAPWARLLAGRLRRAGIYVPDQTFGLRWSGALTKERLLGLIRNLPPGVSEIYLHPAARGGFEGAAPGYAYAEEFAALCAPEVIQAVGEGGLRTGGFQDFASEPASRPRAMVAERALRPLLP